MNANLNCVLQEDTSAEQKGTEVLENCLQQASATNGNEQKQHVASGSISQDMRPADASPGIKRGSFYHFAFHQAILHRYDLQWLLHTGPNSEWSAAWDQFKSSGPASSLNVLSKRRPLHQSDRTEFFALPATIKV